MKPKPILAFLLSSLLCGCATHPRTGLDPEGLGMDSFEYLEWVLSLPPGPPLRP